MATMFEGEFECANCGETFPNSLTTKVTTQTFTPGGPDPSQVFHSPECSLEWEKRGGKGRDDT